MSCNVSKRLNNIISSPGNTLINGFFRVSSKIINATKDIINTIKYEKNLGPVFTDFLTVLSVSFGNSFILVLIFFFLI